MIRLALCPPNATDIAACALLSLLVQAQALDHAVAARRPWGGSCPQLPLWDAVFLFGHRLPANPWEVIIIRLQGGFVDG